MLLHRNLEATHVAILQAPHSCEDGAVEKLERWGAAGYSRSCVENGMAQGHWMAWEGKRKVIDGNYVNGKEQGVWTFLSSDGKTERIIEYDQGKVIRDSLHRLDRERATSPSP